MTNIFNQVSGAFMGIWARITVFMPTLLFALAIFIAGIIVANLMLKASKKGLEKSKLDASAHGFLLAIIKVALYLVVIVSALSSLGADLSSVVTIIGAAGLAVGLALQNSLSNVAGGFIILFTKPFKKGDYIDSCGVSGLVEEISILSTTLKTLDNKVVRIPNGMLSSSTIVNYNDEPLRRLDVEIPIAYDADYKKAEKIIIDVAARMECAEKDPAPFARVTAFGPNGVVITAKIWVKENLYWDLNSDFLEAVKDEFDKEKIQITYSQIIVHKA